MKNQSLYEGTASAIRGAFFALLIAAGCIAQSSDASAGKSDDTLRWASRYAISTLDPYYNTNAEAIFDNGWLIWDTLVYQDPDSLDMKPLLATSWAWRGDKALVFKLRDDVKWHNGKPFTADDVVYTFNYIVNPASKITVPSNANWIESAQKVGPNEVVLNLKEAFPAALEYLAKLLLIVPNGFYGPDGAPGANGGLVGTGPYKVTAFVPGASVELERSDSYMANSPKNKGAIRKIHYSAIPEPTTQIAELISGKIDWIWNVPSDQADRLARLPNIEVKSQAGMRISFISFNMREMEGGNPLLNAKVRQAIAYAVNRDAITKNVIGPGADVLDTPCYHTQFGCAPASTVYKYNVDRAKALLAEAGYPKGFTLKLVVTNQRPREWTLAITGDLERIGITVETEFLQYGALRERMIANKVHLYLGTHNTYALQDVGALWGIYFAMQGDDQTYDKALADIVLKANSEVDVAKRKALFVDAQKSIIDNMYWYPLWTIPARYAYTKDLNFKSVYDEITRFYDASWK